jgi:hypothetical protein
MKKYLAMFLGSADGNMIEEWNKLPEEERKAKEAAGMEAWKKWATDNAAVIKEMGSPLGRTKLVNRSGVSDTKNAMAAWTVVEAASHDDAAKLFVGHPHFTHFPGDRVEVMEMLPIPGME